MPELPELNEWERQQLLRQRERVLRAFGFLHVIALGDQLHIAQCIMDRMPCPWCGRMVVCHIQVDEAPHVDAAAVETNITLAHDGMKSRPCPYFLAVAHDLATLNAWPSHESPGIVPMQVMRYTPSVTT